MSAFNLTCSSPAAPRCVAPVSFGRRAPLALLLVALISLAGSQAATQEGERDPTPGAVVYQIPSQPLTPALQAYSQASGVEVLYESQIAAGLQSAPVQGAFTAQIALRVLLAGTDLVVHYNRSNAITLSLPSDEQLPPSSPFETADLQLDTLRVSGGQPRPDQRLMREFSESVQLDIEAALRKHPGTRSGNYRASVRLWVDQSRTVRKAELAQSTGDGERDERIADVLRGVVLRQMPPANAPQPVRVVIFVRSL